MKNGFWNKKRVVVTGASGFIGSHFVEELVGRGAYVIACTHRSKVLNYLGTSNNRVTVNKVDLLSLGSILKKLPQVDTVIHCAALEGNMEYKLKNSATILQTSSQMASNILSFAQKKQISNVVLISSVKVYTESYPGQLIQNIHDGHILAKIFTEILGRLFAHQYSLKVFLPRLTNTYGPRDKFGIDSGRVISTMIEKILMEEQVEIWGSGQQSRSFIYVRDAVSMVLNAVEVGKYREFDVTTGENITIVKLAKLIGILTHKNVRLKFNTKKPSGPQKIEHSMIQKIVGNKIKLTPLKEGLKKTIQWYQNDLQNFK